MMTTMRSRQLVTDVDDDECSQNSDDLPVDLVFIVVLNSMLFRSEQIIVVDFDAEVDAATCLNEAIESASDGDTIGVRGSLRCNTLELGSFVELGQGNAVRLLGVPAVQPWTSSDHVHAGTSNTARSLACNTELRNAEKEAAKVLGFPCAHIHVESNCLEISVPLWLESIRVTSGWTEKGGSASYLAPNDGDFCAAVCLFEDLPLN
jgi:hypothetical protein